MPWLRSIRTWFARNTTSVRRVPTFRPVIEGMEERLVPANVTAAVNAGILTVTATPGVNHDSIEIYNSSQLGRLAIVGGNGTTINGVTNFEVKGVRSVVLDLKGGDDDVVFSAQIPGALTFNGGNGTNSLTIDSPAIIGGSVSYVNGTTAANSDELILGGESYIGKNVNVDFGEGIGYGVFSNVTIGGNVSVKAGAGADSIATNKLNVLGSFTASLGDGDNFVGIEALNDGVSQKQAPTLIGRALNITTGTGSDTIDLGSEDDVTVLGRFNLTTGSEASGGDTVKVDNATFYSAVSIKLGGGTDVCFFDTVDNLNRLTEFHDLLTVLGGAGDDIIAFGQATGTCTADLSMPPVLDGGAGDDKLLLIELAVDGVDVEDLAKLGSLPLNFESIVVL